MWQPVQVSPLVRRQILQSGSQCTVLRAAFRAGAEVAVHSHPHEQVSVVVSGRMTLTLDGVAHELAAGDSLLMHGGVPHGVVAHEDTIVLETFSPPREDLLASDVRVG